MQVKNPGPEDQVLASPQRGGLACLKTHGVMEWRSNGLLANSRPANLKSATLRGGKSRWKDLWFALYIKQPNAHWLLRVHLGGRGSRVERHKNKPPQSDRPIAITTGGRPH